MFRKDYPYLYETHMHTSEASKCGEATGAEMVRAAKAAGYSGIIITNHNWYGNHCIDESLPWKQWVKEFCKGYENAKKEGEKVGLDVFFGYEAGYRGTEFLIYGVDEDWLATHQEIKDADVAEQYRLVKEAGGMIIHAHPFREEWYISEIRLFPEYVDGIEAVNATHSSPLSKGYDKSIFDERAIQYAQKYNLPMTAGSDVHSEIMFGGGVAFKRRIVSIKDYCRAIMSGEDYLITNGKDWFDKFGNIIGTVLR